MVGILEEAPRPKGIVTVEVIYPDGNKDVFVVENRIVAQGRDFMLRNTIGVNTVNINFVAFSNDNTNPADTETSMPGTWVYTVTATKSQVGPRHVRWSATLDGGASGVSGNTLASVGLCTGSNGSGLFARVKLPSTIGLASGVTVNVNYDVTIT
jgi:hypothetical protein